MVENIVFIVDACVEVTFARVGPKNFNFNSCIRGKAQNLFIQEYTHDLANKNQICLSVANLINIFKLKKK